MQDDWFKVDLPEYLLPPDLKPHPEEENENNDSKRTAAAQITMKLMTTLSIFYHRPWVTKKTRFMSP